MFDALASLALDRIVGLALVGLLVGTLTQLLYGLHTGERAPVVVPLIAGLGVAGVLLNSAAVLVQFVGEGTPVLDGAATNVLALAGAGVGAHAGARVGDDLGPNVRALFGAGRVDRDVNRLVRSVGRFVTVTVPKEIDDLPEYEPVPDETKAKLAGSELVFPRGLTVSDLHDRLVDRLTHDYGVGRVDVELTDEGRITHLALGSRAAGVGPTLPPGSVAVAVHTDPAFDASPGDRVHLWRRGPGGSTRDATGELRGVDGDFATLAIDEGQFDKIDSRRDYRLVTVPDAARPEREFAHLLRTANETLETITIDPRSTLVGLPVGALRPTVLAVRGDRLETLPSRWRRLAAGDTLYALGRRGRLRRLGEAAAAPPRDTE